MDESRSYRRATKYSAIIAICGGTFLGVPNCCISSEPVVPATTESPSASAPVASDHLGESESLHELIRGGWNGVENPSTASRSHPTPLPLDATAKSLAELLRRGKPNAPQTSLTTTRPVADSALPDLIAKTRTQFSAKAVPTKESKAANSKKEASNTEPEAEEIARLPGAIESPRPAELLHPIELKKQTPRIVHVAKSPASVMPQDVAQPESTDNGRPDLAVSEPIREVAPQAVVIEEEVVTIEEASVPKRVLAQAEANPEPETLVQQPEVSSITAMKSPSTEGIDEAELIPENKSQKASPSVITRIAAGAQGFGQLAMDSLKPPVEKPDTEEPTARPLTTVHENRLRELARESLQTAVHRLSRGATHSAKRSTTESLSYIVAMLDARDGGNTHAQKLAVALDAIRESYDFAQTHVVTDHDALVRLVAVHKTTALKRKPLQNMSALTAVDEYLRVAHENLVSACESTLEASDALVLMGKVEHRINSDSDSHSALVAMTHHRAAVTVDPKNPIAHRELGKTLYGHGMVEQAGWSFARAVELQPTREHYRLLLQVAQRMRDVETIRQCKIAINDPRLADPLPLRHLDAKSFAATYKPNAIDSQAVNARNKTVSARSSASVPRVSDDRPKSTLSQFKSWMPKFRRE